MIPDSGPGIFLLWGAFMAALGAIAVIAFDPHGPETPSLLFGSGAVMLLLVLVMAARRVGDAAPEGPRAEPDLSPATVWLVAAAVLGAMGAELGLWLALIAAGMALAGLAALARELRAQRRTLRETSDEDAAP